MPVQPGPLSSPPAIKVHASVVPARIRILESSVGVVPHSEAVRFVPVPTTWYHRPRAELMDAAGAVAVTMAFDSTVAPVKVPVVVLGTASSWAPSALSLSGVLVGITTMPIELPPVRAEESVADRVKCLTPVAVPAATVATAVNRPSPAASSPPVPSSTMAAVAEPPIELRSIVSEPPVGLARLEWTKRLAVRRSDCPSSTVNG